MKWRQQIPHKEQLLLRKKREYTKRERKRRKRKHALMFPISIGIPREGLLCGTKEFDGVESGAWLAAKKREKTASLGGITESVSCSFLPTTSLAWRVNALGR